MHTYIHGNALKYVAFICQGAPSRTSKDVVESYVYFPSLTLLVARVVVAVLHCGI